MREDEAETQIDEVVSVLQGLCIMCRNGDLDYLRYYNKRILYLIHDDAAQLMRLLQVHRVESEHEKKCESFTAYPGSLMELKE